MVHDKGGLVYGDGANLNAIMGRTRPGDLGIDVMQFNLHKTFTTPHGGGGPGCGPVGYKKRYSIAVRADSRGRQKKEDGSVPVSISRAVPKSVGRLRSFHGNFGMMVRAYTYLREMGRRGPASGRASSRSSTRTICARVPRRDLARRLRPRSCMHEVVISDKHLKDAHVTTMDVAKRLMDYGYHPPTVYFPLVVKGAMLVEPTETETKQELDRFVEAMAAISAEALSDPESVKAAPHLTRLRRLDETRAARSPVLRHEVKAAAE